MQTTPVQTPLIELLPLAVERGAIDSWDVQGPHLVFRVGSDRIYVQPVIAGRCLAALLGACEPPRRFHQRMMRVSLN